MKINKILLLAIPALLFMTACQNNSSQRGGDNSSTGDAADQSGNSSSQSGEGTDGLVADVLSFESSSTGFPIENVEEFVEFYDLDLTIPAVGADSLEWYCYAASTDGRAYLYLSAEDDDDLIGTNSLEDQMKTALENNGVTVADDNYDDYGYEVVFDDGADASFYTFYDMFYFFLTGPEVYSESTSFPTVRFAGFLDYYEFPSNTPIPESSANWHYLISTDGEFFCFEAYCTDNGTIGTDSIEDTYKATLVEAGFEIDDSEYDTDGYYATQGDLLIQFFTYDGEFDVWFNNANAFAE